MAEPVGKTCKVAIGVPVTRLMTRERAFVASVVENPDDPAARLIYADWLEESGHANFAASVRAKKVGVLTYREREILKLRYGAGDGYLYTLEEVGRIFKMTRERVRQLECKGLRKLGLLSC